MPSRSRLDAIQRRAAILADLQVRLNRRHRHDRKTLPLPWGLGTIEHCAGCGEVVRFDEHGQPIGYIAPRREVGHAVA